jgi:hypothetical protein
MAMERAGARMLAQCVLPQNSAGAATCVNTHLILHTSRPNLSAIDTCCSVPCMLCCASRARPEKAPPGTATLLAARNNCTQPATGQPENARQSVPSNAVLAARRTTHRNRISCLPVQAPCCFCMAHKRAAPGTTDGQIRAHWYHDGV